MRRFEDLPFRAIEIAAKAEGLPPDLVAGVVWTESKGDPYAIRFETDWRYPFEVKRFAKKHRISKDTELALQSMSWGLMQVMGSVAREHGFDGHLLELISPSKSLLYGCKHLAKFGKRHDSMEDVIAAYNAGSPRDRDGDGVVDNYQYVEQVDEAMGLYQEHFRS